MSIQAQRYIDHFKNIMKNGTKIFPRGEEVLEVGDLQLVVDPREPFMMFKSRNLKIDYFKKEMLWKLGASQYDESIKDHAKIWSSVQNPDGSFYSNYGLYWFAGEVNIFSVVTELIRDPDSRRAVIPMLSAKHMAPWVKDTVCTECVGFRLRRDNTIHPDEAPPAKLRLEMSVHMRSSDSVFGLGTDIPTFAFLYRLVAALLQPCFGNDIHFGDITITAMSSHIYSRHYKMVEKIIVEGVDWYETIDMPMTKHMEAMYLISKRGKMTDIPIPYNLARWLVRDGEKKSYAERDPIGAAYFEEHGVQ